MALVGAYKVISTYVNALTLIRLFNMQQLYGDAPSRIAFSLDMDVEYDCCRRRAQARGERNWRWDDALLGHGHWWLSTSAY